MPYRAVLEFDACGRAFLSDGEIHHLVRVRRLGEGEMFLGLARNQAAWYRCRLGRQGGEWVVDIVTRIGTVGESSPRDCPGSCFDQEGALRVDDSKGL